MYKKLISAEQVDEYGEYVLSELNNSLTKDACTAAISFLSLFTQEASASLLQALYAQLLKQDGADYSLQDIKNNIPLQEKLGLAITADQTSDPLEKRIIEFATLRSSLQRI